MKAKKTDNGSYAVLKRKLLLRTMMLFGVSVVVVLLLRSLSYGRVANGLTRLISLFVGDWERSVQIYRNYIGNNLDIILLVSVLIVFFVILRIYLNFFTKYFDQIAAGIDNLASESDVPVEMSEELEFIETTLNETKEKLKQRADEVRYAEERKNELVVYLAHDIKTPLTSVVGYLSLLDEAPDMPTEQKARYTHIALEKAYRLEALINEFFEITRYNYQSVPLYKRPVNLYYMMMQIADELYPQLTESKKTIELDMAEDLMIEVDAEKMARVINNILKNAVAYGDEDSEITVVARQYPDKTVMRFVNRGTVPSEKLRDIFEKFYRLDESRASATGGAGLGLAIAKDIVELHGGTITADSDKEHTFFTIELPAVQKKNKDA